MFLSAEKTRVSGPWFLFRVFPPSGTTGKNISDTFHKTQPRLAFNSGFACFCLGSEKMSLPWCLALRQ